MPQSGVGARTIFFRAATRALLGPLLGWDGGPIPSAEDVRVEARGGSLQVTVLQASALPAAGVVVLCHPFLKYGMHYFVRQGLHTGLLERGFHVVLFNFAGFGRSDLRGAPFTEDVLAVTAFARSRFPDLPCSHLGSSFGGFQLAHALGADEASFSRVLLDSAPLSITRFFASAAQRKLIGRLCESHFAQALGMHSIDVSLARVRACRVSLLYGSSDRYLPHEDIEQLRKRARMLQLFRFEDCGHLELAKKRPRDYWERVVLALTHEGGYESTLRATS